MYCRHWDEIASLTHHVQFRSFPFSSCHLTCDIAPPRCRVLRCCFPVSRVTVPLRHHRLILRQCPWCPDHPSPSSHYPVYTPKIPMSMSPEILSFPAALGIPTVERPSYPIFLEASPWHTSGFRILAAGSALIWRGGTASVAAAVGPKHDRTSQRPSILIRVQLPKVLGPFVVSARAK